MMLVPSSFTNDIVNIITMFVPIKTMNQLIDSQERKKIG